MEFYWSNRIWDMYVDMYYAKIKVDFESDPMHWVMLASKRHGSDGSKWYGL